MTNQIITISLLITGVISSVYSGGLTIYAADHFYEFQDQIDSTRSKSEHYADLGVVLTDIGGSGLSLHSNLIYTTALSELLPDGITRAAGRQPLHLTSGYLGWRSSEGVTALKLGRQQFTNLAVNTFDFDGLNISISPNKNTSFSFGGGLLVPTPIIVDYNTNKPLLSNPENSTIYMADFYNASIPYTTLNGAFTLESSLQGESAIRIALGTTVTPNDFVRFDGTGRFSTAVNGLDHFDARLTFLPSNKMEIATWFLSDRDRIDSLNYFSIMLHEQLTEIGAKINYYLDGGGCVQGGYHISSTKNEGSDQFFLVNASNKYLDGGITLGTGYHGMTLQPRGGFSFPLLSFFWLKGSAEYYLVKEADEEESHNLMSFSAGIKGVFPFGLTVYPRAEYISNRYYKEDIRLLVTTSLLLHNYWRSR